MVVISWNLAIGYTGVLLFGQLAFFGIGGYTTGLMTLELSISPWIGLFIGGFVAALCGFLIGLPLLRLKGLSVVLVTFAFQEIVRVVILNLRDVTGGIMGLHFIPPFAIGLYVFGEIENYWLALALLVTIGSVIYLVVKSPSGLAFIALRDSERFAVGRGVNPFKYKLFVFTMTAFLTGVAGGFYAHFMGMVAPSMISFDVLILLWLMLVIGGIGSLWGSLIGPFLIVFINESLRIVEDTRLIIMGALMVILMLFLPSGIGKELRKSVREFLHRLNS